MSDPFEFAWSIPELHTRPDAIAYMGKNDKLRRSFERIRHDLIGTANRMQDHRCAAEVISLLWQARIAELTRVWKGRMDLHVFGQIHGALRNIYLNQVARATGKQQHLRDVDVAHPEYP